MVSLAKFRETLATTNRSVSQIYLKQTLLIASNFFYNILHTNIHSIRNIKTLSTFAVVWSYHFHLIKFKKFYFPAKKNNKVLWLDVIVNHSKKMSQEETYFNQEAWTGNTITGSCCDPIWCQSESSFAGPSVKLN